MKGGPLDPKPKGRGMLRALGSGTAAVSLVLALVIGMQLGGVPWRYRKQLWQLQGALVGAVVGYVLGRLSGGGDENKP